MDFCIISLISKLLDMYYEESNCNEGSLNDEELLGMIELLLELRNK